MATIMRHDPWTHSRYYLAMTYSLVRMMEGVLCFVRIIFGRPGGGGLCVFVCRAHLAIYCDTHSHSDVVDKSAFFINQRRREKRSQFAKKPNPFRIGVEFLVAFI